MSDQQLEVSENSVASVPEDRMLFMQVINLWSSSMHMKSY